MPETTCKRPTRRACSGPVAAVRIGQGDLDQLLCVAHQDAYRELGYAIHRPAGTVHDLDARYFDAVASGAKPFEIHQDDRGYQVGDVLVLREWDAGKTCVSGYAACPCHYTGRTIRRTVTAVVRHEDHEGIAPGFVVLGLAKERGG